MKQNDFCRRYYLSSAGNTLLKFITHQSGDHPGYLVLK
jgi:hypothetical protein